jgi:hypothetical protein
LTGHEWERAPESPWRAAAVRTARRGVRRRGVTQRGVRRGAVKRGAVRRGMGKMMVMILELRKTRRQNQCQLMYNVQWMTEFSRTRLSLIFLSALGQKLC